jgi:hypothetical protein
MGIISVLPPFGNIPLLLAEPERGTEYSPAGTRVGLITLQAWQVSPVLRVPDSFGQQSAYLIRIPYDLDLEPDAPMPLQFEIGFTFLGAKTSVHAALPQPANLDDKVRTYVLNAQLTFTPQDHPVTEFLLGDIELPPTAAKVELYGLGSSMVRWRHHGSPEAPVSPGSHIGWIVLLTPPGRRRVRVCATARFKVPAERSAMLRETDRPDAFTVKLPERQPIIVHRRTAGGPRVFVSYAHDSEQHKEAVNNLCRLLESAGIDITWDENETLARKDWNQWMTIGITRSDYVIVVASPIYRSAGLYDLGDRFHRGVQTEFRVLQSLLAEDRDIWMPKILPVVLPGRKVQEIPLALQPRDADHYIVPSLTTTGVAGLLRVINNGAGSPP